MRKLRIYIDTSVIGGCLDDEFRKWSNVLLKEFCTGEKIAVISNLTRLELEPAPKQVKEILEKIPEESIEEVYLEDEARELASKYISDGVITSKHLADARHIAIAVVEKVDVLVSWNFKDIVNLDHIRAFNAVNLKLGYSLIEIRSPVEVIHAKEI